MVTIGIKGREEAVVLPELTAKHIGSGIVGQGTHERFIIDRISARNIGCEYGEYDQP